MASDNGNVGFGVAASEVVVEAVEALEAPKAFIDGQVSKLSSSLPGGYRTDNYGRVKFSNARVEDKGARFVVTGELSFAQTYHDPDTWVLSGPDSAPVATIELSYDLKKVVSDKAHVMSLSIKIGDDVHTFSGITFANKQMVFKDGDESRLSGLFAGLFIPFALAAKADGGARADIFERLGCAQNKSPGRNYAPQVA